MGVGVRVWGFRGFGGRVWGVRGVGVRVRDSGRGLAVWEKLTSERLMVFLKLGLVHELHRVAYHVLAEKYAYVLNTQIAMFFFSCTRTAPVALHKLADRHAHALNPQIQKKKGGHELHLVAHHELARLSVAVQDTF